MMISVIIISCKEKVIIKEVISISCKLKNGIKTEEHD